MELNEEQKQVILKSLSKDIEQIIYLYPCFPEDYENSIQAMTGVLRSLGYDKKADLYQKEWKDAVNFAKEAAKFREDFMNDDIEGL